MTITLDSRLANDTYRLGAFAGSELLLMNNALFPWFVIVPDTTETEFYSLNRETQMALLEQINCVSQFITGNFRVDKLNIGAIGNIVSQMHIHVVGRRHDDPCWPHVVWGCKHSLAYQTNELTEIINKLKQLTDFSANDLLKL